MVEVVFGGGGLFLFFLFFKCGPTLNIRGLKGKYAFIIGCFVFLNSIKKMMLKVLGLNR